MDKLGSDSLYRRLGRLLETMPSFQGFPSSPDTKQWLGRAYAMVLEIGDIDDAARFKLRANNIIVSRDRSDANSAVEEIQTILYRALGVAELRAPPGAAGAFIAVGDSFDALVAISKVLQTASTDVLIVDPYMDETVLSDYGLAVPERVPLRLLADENDHKPLLKPAANRWCEQYGATRPLALRLASPRILHDRAIFIDSMIAWTLTQSLKDFAKRSPAEIVRADDVAALKIAAYENTWSQAQGVV